MRYNLESITTDQVLEMLLERNIIKKTEFGYVFQTDSDGVVWSRTRAARAITSAFRYLHDRHPSMRIQRKIKEATKEYLIKWPEYEAGSTKYQQGLCDRVELMDSLLNIDLSKSTSKERKRLSACLKRFLVCKPEEREDKLRQARRYAKRRFGHLLKDQTSLSDQTSAFQPEDMSQVLQSLQPFSYHNRYDDHEDSKSYDERLN